MTSINSPRFFGPVALRANPLARRLRITTTRTAARVSEPAGQHLRQALPARRLQPMTACRFEPGALIGLLTFCYAHRLYSSREIARRLHASPRLRQACGQALPNAEFLRRFRDLNRVALGHSLRAALLSAAGDLIADEYITGVKGAHLAEEANRRIIMAMFTDSMELDAARP